MIFYSLKGDHMAAKKKVQGKRKAQVHNKKKGSKKLKRQQEKDWEKSLPKGIRKLARLATGLRKKLSRLPFSQREALQRSFLQRLNANR